MGARARRATVPLPARRHARLRAEDEIRSELRALLREHRPERFPAPAWLAKHGPPGLADAVRRTGGASRWAYRLSMPPPKPARWTDDLIEAELRRLFAAHERWPTQAQFQAVGATGLRRAVYAGHGSRWWAERIGLSTTGLRNRRKAPRFAARHAPEVRQARGQR